MRISRREVLGSAALALLLRPAWAEEGPRCFDQLLGRRRMIRKFRAEPVSDEVVRRIVRTARSAPSAGHTQPWSYVVVREAAQPARRRR